MAVCVCALCHQPLECDSPSPYCPFCEEIKDIAEQLGELPEQGEENAD